MSATEAARRDALRALLRREKIGTQHELARRLAREGYDVTQATLSRDLARIEARRTALPGGGTVYELPEPAADDDLPALQHLVRAVDHNDALVVVTTLPGGASAVALAIDRARLSTVLGTIAGDDTIFVAPARKSTPATLAKQLQILWRQ
jgi:transcriptional regulator of arginine metabolism